MMIANVLGIFVLFYVLWKRLKDDYHYEKIFNLAFGITLSFLIGIFILSSLDRSYSFWVELIIISIGFIIITKKQKMKFFESVDAFIIGSLPWLAFLYLYDTSRNSSLSSFIGFWFILICIFIYFFINSSYKNFSWYKSGRIGISGLLTAIIFFIFRIFAAILVPNMIFLAKNYEIYLSLSGALLLLILLYNLKKLNP